MVGLHGDWGKLSSSEPQYTQAYLGVKCQVRMDEAKVRGGLGNPQKRRCMDGIRSQVGLTWNGLLYNRRPRGSGCGLGSPLAGHSTQLVGGWGYHEGMDPVVAGAGLPSGHREAEALQEAGEEQEQLHAGQGLP